MKDSNSVIDLPLEHCKEYDAAAEYFARFNKLPMCMNANGALLYIQSDTEAFEQRVKQFKYEMAMSKNN